jgi:hypothetical protein
MCEKIQFRLEQRTANESGVINVRERHLPWLKTSYSDMPVLSPIVDYSLWTQEAQTYNFGANTSYFVYIKVE